MEPCERTRTERAPPHPKRDDADVRLIELALDIRKTKSWSKYMSRRAHRKCLTSLVKDVDEEDMLVYLYMDVPIKDSGCDGILPCKLIHHGKNSSMYGHENFCHSTSTPSTINSHHLLISSYGVTLNLGLCQLCHYRHCTLLHILNACSHSLQDEKIQLAPLPNSEGNYIWSGTLRRRSKFRERPNIRV